MAVGAGVFDEDVGTIEVEVEEALAQNAGAAALKGEEELLVRGGVGLDEGVGEAAVAGDVVEGEDAADAGVPAAMGAGVDAGDEWDELVLLGVEGAFVGEGAVGGAFEQGFGVVADVAEEEDEVGLVRCGDEGVFATEAGEAAQQGESLDFLELFEVDLHGFEGGCARSLFECLS